MSDPLPELVELRLKLRMIISHASGGVLSKPDDIDRSTNDICVEISRHNNRIWQHAQETALAQISPIEDAIDSGRSGLQPSGHSASPEPVVSALRASVPNASDIRLLNAGPDHRGGFAFTFADGNEDGLIHLLAAHLYEMMGCGTPHELNCVQMEVKPRDYAQAFTLTLQREGGKSPLRLKAEAVKLLQQALEAIESQRSEPLFIMRDAIRNWLEDDLTAQGIEARSDETPQEVQPEGQEPGPKDAPNE